MARTPHYTLALSGDVMTGRGIDQLLPHPGDPTLRERWVRDARDYLRLAEEHSGPIQSPVDPLYLWGAAARALDRIHPFARLINLETSVTTSDDFDLGKGIHYRMHPENLACLTSARIDACTLANNHVLDYGRAGLLETLETLRRAGIVTAGAGRDLHQARAPGRVPLPHGGGLLLFGMGTWSSGIDADWSAAPDTPGVNLLPELSAAVADEVAGQVRSYKRPGDLAIASIHWGTNWGYEVPEQHVAFARRLIDGGVDLVHGHSSHHPRPIELYRGKLVLYGCGDFINDYEGIRGYEEYRDELRPLYLPTLSAGDGALEELRIVLLKSRRLSLVDSSQADRDWLSATLTSASERFGTRVSPTRSGDLRVQAGSRPSERSAPFDVPLR